MPGLIYSFFFNTTSEALDHPHIFNLPAFSKASAKREKLELFDIKFSPKIFPSKKKSVAEQNMQLSSQPEFIAQLHLSIRHGSKLLAAFLVFYANSTSLPGIYTRLIDKLYMKA